MDLEGLQCHGCGSTNVTFDPKRRILSCNQCGKEEYYSRSTLNANGKVVYARRNAIHFFKEGRMDDARELCTVIDTICPFLISKRTSAGYLTDNLVDMYRELAEHCGIPKTCFALLKSIETNPDSPYVGQSFYLKAKVRYFYDNYVVNVGKVIRAMNDANLKAKFVGAYENKCQQYKADAGMS